MITRIGFAPRRAGLSIAEAQRHWRTNHAAAAGALPGLRRYWQMHAVLDGDWPLLPWAGFDCCSELDFDSIADIDRAFVSPQYFDHVRPDEERLVARRLGGSLTTKRRLLDGTIDPSHVRLMTFMHVAALHDPGALADAVEALPAAGGASARELHVALTGPAAAQRASLFDVVESLWFERAEEAAAFVRSGEQAERRYAVAGLVRGTEHLIARIHVVR